MRLVLQHLIRTTRTLSAAISLATRTMVRTIPNNGILPRNSQRTPTPIRIKVVRTTPCRMRMYIIIQRNSAMRRNPHINSINNHTHRIPITGTQMAAITDMVAGTLHTMQDMVTRAGMDQIMEEVMVHQRAAPISGEHRCATGVTTIKAIPAIAIRTSGSLIRTRVHTTNR